jgi:hypothetical protein
MFDDCISANNIAKPDENFKVRNSPTENERKPELYGTSSATEQEFFQTSSETGRGIKSAVNVQHKIFKCLQKELHRFDFTDINQLRVRTSLKSLAAGGHLS